MPLRKTLAALLMLVPCLSLASSVKYEITFYNAYHFNYFYEKERVKAVYAIPEVVDNANSVTPGAPTRLLPGTTEPAHLFGTGKTTAYANIYADGSMRHPVELRVRYVVYLSNGKVSLTDYFSMPAGEFRSIYGMDDDKKKEVAAQSETEFANKKDGERTANLFYVSQDYRKTIVK
ncbi:MAG: hypothetical protein HY537_01180 [Deltaproteobacteria bacterium]|nr:hypothetical protein [Deltaproteobacteria bacterium]